ncbi:MAG: orotate phosphoribosyltransferase [Candidatus Omnitrophota bacterium]
MNEEKVLDILKENQALLEGHFKLSSGLHSDGYVQCALVLQYPDVAEQLSRRLSDMLSDITIDAVIGPALGGVTFAYEVARQLGVRGIFAERKNGAMALRRGFSVAKDERILVVEDVITTGGSVKEVIALVRSFGAIPVAVGSIIDRSEGAFQFDGEFKSLAKVHLKTYAEKDCPLCKEKIPIAKPGSKG